MHRFSYLDHNWLPLKINNQTLSAHLKQMRGCVYDLGCGIRPYEHDILSVADKYIGVDWAETMHDLKADVVADLNKPLPIENMMADTVVSFQVIEHLSEPQIMLNEAFRILKPNSYIFLTSPWQWSIHEAPYDYFRYSLYGLKYLFDKAGFVDVKVIPQSGFFTTWILKMNYFTFRFVRGPQLVVWLVRMTLLPFWFVGQVVAPYLDKLDWNWALEASGYYVIARKPAN
jgi:SAM-dependent methyltransferase